jgi:hypothetical protein
VAQSGSAPGWGPGGRRFKSCLPDRRADDPGVLRTVPKHRTEQIRGGRRALSGGLSRIAIRAGLGATTRATHADGAGLHARGGVPSWVVGLILRGICIIAAVLITDGKRPDCTSERHLLKRAAAFFAAETETG